VTLAACTAGSGADFNRNPGIGEPKHPCNLAPLYSVLLQFSGRFSMNHQHDYQASSIALLAPRSLMAPRVVETASIWSRLGATLDSWSRRNQARRELAQLDERMLQDIGLTRLQVELEITKPFWQR
jgi:uncharacterized protein YjiS (DUF1127 family)